MKERLGIVGGGMAGLSAAYFLRKKYDVTLFEKSSHVGGHAQTVQVDYAGTPIKVDTGVMIFDHAGYHNFGKLLASLGCTELDRLRCDLLGASFESGNLEFSNGSPVSQRSNLTSSRLWKMLCQYLLFIRRSEGKFRKDPLSLADRTFATLLQELAVDRDCIDYVIGPFFGCIFSLSSEEVLAWPASMMVGFLHRHNLLSVMETLGVSGKRNVYTVRGGTKAYLDRMVASLPANAVRLNSHVAHIRREERGVSVLPFNGQPEIFDKIVLATHADEALQIIVEPTSNERELLQAFPYSKKKKLIVHRDPAVMPIRKSCWAAFTCNDGIEPIDGGFAVTYWMNQIQNIDPRYPLFISLNTEAVRRDLRFAELSHKHVAFSVRSARAQKQLHRLQGIGGVYYCGSYFGYGVHEDALASSMAVSDLLGGDVPWGRHQACPTRASDL